MSSACSETEGSSSGQWLYIHLWYSVLYMHQYKQYCTVRKGVCCVHTVLPARLHSLLPARLHTLLRTTPNHNCIYKRLPEDEPLVSKHVEDINIKVLI
jgi:hypothetical protein